MKRFILITFGFMAWGFYELSDGAEFEPASAGLEASEPVIQAELPAASVPEASSDQTDEVVFVDTTPPQADDSQRPTVTITNLAAAVQAVTPQTAPTEQPAAENIDVAQTDGTDLTNGNSQLIIPSLINLGDDESQSQNTVFTNNGDVRIVSGSRVNVRGGPGTDFGVVTKLGRGDEVEILQDNGDGWVKMRPLDGGPEGWMADFLLTSG